MEGTVPDNTVLLSLPKNSTPCAGRAGPNRFRRQVEKRRMAITAKMVSGAARDATGAAMMECKKALTGDRGRPRGRRWTSCARSGLKGAEKRADRGTWPRAVWASHVSATDGKIGAIVALTSETDFVARTDDFASLLAEDLAKHVVVNNPESARGACSPSTLDSGGATPRSAKRSRRSPASSARTCRLRKLCRYENACRSGWAGYVHHDGKSGALISVTTGAGPDEQVAAFLQERSACTSRPSSPSCARTATRPPGRHGRPRAQGHTWRATRCSQAKPEDKREMIVKGKLEKFFAEIRPARAALGPRPQEERAEGPGRRARSGRLEDRGLLPVQVGSRQEGASGPPSAERGLRCPTTASCSSSRARLSAIPRPGRGIDHEAPSTAWPVQVARVASLGVELAIVCRRRATSCAARVLQPGPVPVGPTPTTWACSGR